MSNTGVVVRQLGMLPYRDVWANMQEFTNQRTEQTQDQIWLVQHPPVFTQGQAGKAEHLIAPGDIPVIATDRGGQVTFHGPGQLVAYPLLDLRRLKLGVRDLVTAIETSVVEFVQQWGVIAAPKAEAPGVYVNGEKLASLGLRVRRGCSFHGVSINIAMDLEPFGRINPCGYARLKMTQLGDLVDLNGVSHSELELRYAESLLAVLGLKAIVPSHE